MYNLFVILTLISSNYAQEDKWCCVDNHCVEVFSRKWCEEALNGTYYEGPEPCGFTGCLTPTKEMSWGEIKKLFTQNEK